jgi:hypothetical protein
MGLWEERICEELTELGAGDAAKKIRAAKWTTIAGEFEDTALPFLLHYSGAIQAREI